MTETTTQPTELKFCTFGFGNNIIWLPKACFNN